LHPTLKYGVTLQEYLLPNSLSRPEIFKSMMYSRKVLFFIFSLCFAIVKGQDTTPPVLISPARDTSFECGQVQDLPAKLAQWYNNAAGATFSDNSGSFTIQSNITLTQANTIFNNSLDVLCGNTQKVDVIFWAVDPSGNMSVRDTASFFTTDVTKPAINMVPNVTYKCVETIRDTLIQWIKNKAGYVATDQCSNAVQWTNFTFGFFVNNVQVSSGGGNIANGPYPQIPDGLCQWDMKINFFVRDECNNLTITPGTTQFSVTDDVAPSFTNFPADITVECDAVPSPVKPVVIDGCTRNIDPVLTQTTNRDDDPLVCGHYNYIISRRWVATDKCGNASTKTQNITVRDTKGPALQGLQKDTVSCEVFQIRRDSIYIRFADNCSETSINFADSLISTGCTEVIRRRYTIKDVCDNTTIYDQSLKIIKSTGPTITQKAENATYTCTEQLDFNALLFLWVQNMGGSKAESSCGTVQSFAALKGSYKPGDFTTYPGTKPTTLPAQICPSPISGFLRYVEVDFVYYDTCGNVSVSPAIFGVSDNSKPQTTACQKDITVEADDQCLATVKIKIPEATDNCVESSPFITRKIISQVTSSLPPGPESIIDPITVRLGPFNPSTALPVTDGTIAITLRNMDIDDVTEFFYIYDEDNTLLGTSPKGNQQCSSVSFTLTLNRAKLATWIQDGFLDIRFVPNVVQGDAVFAINNICGQSTIETSVTYETDSQNALRRLYQINDEPIIILDKQDSISLTLKTGIHQLTFTFEDCAGNTLSCPSRITVQDKIAPVITCPSNVSSIISLGQCKDTLSLPINFAVKENCGGNRLYDQTVPVSDEAAALSFEWNESKNQFIARSKKIIFNNVFPIRFTDNDVELEVLFLGDNNEPGEVFEIRGPGNFLIGNTKPVSGPGCNEVSKTRFFINATTFNSWITGNQITLEAIPVNGNDGINPCQPLPAGSSLDIKSYIRGRLIYSDARFSFAVSGATFITTTNIDPNASIQNIVLNSGNNIITIASTDAAGNRGTCTFEAVVRDLEPPVARCKNATLTIDPSGITSTSLDPALINNGSTDNCGPVTLSTIPSAFNCNDVNKDVSVTLIVTDRQGNTNSCITSVKVNPFNLKPTFSSGLCSNDTLKLFANIPASTVPGTYSFKWSGPNGLEFNTENPFIPNVTESFNGLYSVTVTGFNGCTTIGSVLVNIKPLTKPSLTSNRAEACEDEEFIFTTTDYSGNITYEWYKGISPTGVLIQKTTSPELIVKPPVLGPHFYYVIARGPDCASDPSALLKVTVLEVPVANVKDLVLSPCEGDDIQLSSASINANFQYQWSGPGGYTANGSSPAAITTVTSANAGNYFLIVKNGICTSDTAVTRVTIFESPARPEIIGPTVICEGQVLTLVAAGSPGAEIYQWFLNGQLYTTNQDNSLSIPGATSGLQGNWTVKTQKGNCESKLSPVKFVGIDVSLNIGASNTGPVCVGDSVRLEATFVPGATYEWSGPVSNIPKVDKPTILAVPGDYSVTVTTPTGCKNNANTTVNVTSVPEIITVSSNAVSCMKKNDVISFFPSIFPDANNYKYEWNGPNGFKSDIRNPKISSLSSSKTGVYSLLVYNGKCPTDTFFLNVDFKIQPDQPSIQAKPFYCEGDTITLISSVTASEYIWNTPLGTIKTVENKIILPKAGPSNQGSYTLQITENGCTSDISVPITIVIRPKPDQPTIFSNSPVCFGDTIRLSTGANPGATYRWTGPVPINNTSNLVEIPNARPNQSGIYTVTTQANGCTSLASLPVTVIVKPAITKPDFTLSELNVCSTQNNGIEVCLSAESLTPGAQYIVRNSSDQKVLGVSNNICQILSDMTSFKEGPNFIIVSAQIDGCLSEVSDRLVVNFVVPPAIVATAIMDEIINCPGENVQLISKYGPPQVNLKWTTFNPDITISNPKSVSPTLSGFAEGVTTVYLDYSVAGCESFSRDTVTITTEFKPLLTDDEYNIAYGTKTLLNILSNDKVPAPYKLVITSNPARGDIKIVDDKIEFSPDPRSVSTETFTYRLCADFCEDLCSEAKVTINIDQNIDCKTPTIFTPNNDGINDVFIIPCIETGLYPNNKLVIFNEWGGEVFSAAPYKNDWSGVFGSNPLPAGTYFYVFETATNAKPINGFLILQR
jgi:gliding motility-associated-like protein